MLHRINEMLRKNTELKELNNNLECKNNDMLRKNTELEKLKNLKCKNMKCRFKSKNWKKHIMTCSVRFKKSKAEITT